ncbi:hypothetical protein MANES_17G004137v8 [Manihot esculenta]|uniref:Uncharacterized protein n=1 Tax=Manihot esculenta TaxID=3983 RepID=A0ACB7G3C5_MANES|nr:hypothetical protein MANES_17G004137v8 [Manihot esculenta]
MASLNSFSNACDQLNIATILFNNYTTSAFNFNSQLNQRTLPTAFNFNPQLIKDITNNFLVRLMSRRKRARTPTPGHYLGLKSNRDYGYRGDRGRYRGRDDYRRSPRRSPYRGGREYSPRHSPPMVEGRGGRGPDHPTLLLIVALGEAIWPIIPYRNHRDVVLTAYGL